jgi:hypothetical protein
MKAYEVIKSYYDMTNDKSKLWSSIKEVSDMLYPMKEAHPDKYWCLMRKIHEVWNGSHYDAIFAKYEVDKMYHTEGEHEVKGEYWSKKQTDEVLSKVRSSVPQSYNEYDFYVALNASYHDYCVSKKQRYPDKWEEEIIEDAIAFWFNDNDKPDGKVWWYFNR